MDGSDYTTVEIRKDLHGLFIGHAGFMTHAEAYDYLFRLRGQGPVYADDEIQNVPVEIGGISAMQDSRKFTGSISVFREKRRVAVNLNANGYPFESNGRFRY